MRIAITYHAHMKHDPGIFEEEDKDAIIASDARARSDYAAGRFYDHAVVAGWLKTWGTSDRKPFREWLKQAKP